MKIRAAIIEDDVEAGRALSTLLSRFAMLYDHTFEFREFGDAVAFLTNYRPVYDLIFLDIDLPHMSGMQAAERLRAMDTETILIFVTGLAQYAVQGYRMDALDFLVKPVDYYSLELVMHRAIQRLERRIEKPIVLNVAGETHVVPVQQIHYVEVLGHYLTFHTAKGELRVKGTLRDIDSMLPGGCFFQCNRYCLVNLSSISSIKRDTIVVGEQEIALSRSRRAEMVEAYARYMGGGHI